VGGLGLKLHFTVLIPTFDNGDLIRTAIDSVLAQSHADFELVIVADGAPESTHAIVLDQAAKDPRVTLRAHPKGDRHGEAYRHQALQESRADAVCYLSDDDFWFADHLATMAGLLGEADFAHTRHVSVQLDLTLMGTTGDLSDAATRAEMRSCAMNFFGLSVAGHRLDAYRHLDEGWSAAPLDVWTDLNMWRKWFAAEGLRFRSSTRITGLHMARYIRKEVTQAFLEREPRTWYEAFRDPLMPVALNRVCPTDQTTLPLYEVFAEANRLRERERGR
jgi:glycosyltransferase involved in cell wall biosynthesis